MDIPVANIVRVVRTVLPTDPIARAQEAMRADGISQTPVVSAGRPIGLVSGDEVLGALVSGDPSVVAESPVSDAMRTELPCVLRSAPVRDVAEFMTAHGLELALVVNEYGMYEGVATRSDVSGALTGTMRPPSVGGMATPLGVYLTTGHIRAGASDLGLVLTGVAMMLMNFVAVWLIYGAAIWIQRNVPGYPMVTLLKYPGAHAAFWPGLLSQALGVGGLVIFMLLLRFGPLSGYHGAEHQVVHAIENGEPLKPKYVSAMPRVHPRCGTNLVAGVLVFTLVAQSFSGETALMLAIFAIIFAGRSIGGAFQRYITTKPASPRQLESGIAAAEELLARYRANPSYRASGWWNRIWNTGMPQVIIGVAVVAFLVHALHLLPAWLF